MIHGGIATLLKADGPIAALVGARVYPVHAVQEPTFPFITFQRISSDRPLYHSGSAHIVESVFQFSCWGAKPVDAYNVALALIAKMQAFKGSAGDMQILLARVQEEREVYDEDASSYQVAVDISIAYRE
jgi:hypothetical protein